MRTATNKLPVVRSRLSVLTVNGKMRELLALRVPFTVEATGYSRRIIAPDCEYLYLSDNGKAIFWATNLIKRDIQASGIVIDQVKNSRIHYYGIADYVKSKRTNKELPTTITLVDITSAYPTTLRNAGLITQETYNKLQALPKIARLKSIGALATNKMQFRYDKGRLVDYSLLKRPDQYLEANYYYCALKVGETIRELSSRLPTTYLFYWFDGIYLKPGADIEAVQHFLRERGYESKVHTLTDCAIETRERTLYFRYKKENDERPHYFHIPLNDEIKFDV